LVLWLGISQSLLTDILWKSVKNYGFAYKGHPFRPLIWKIYALIIADPARHCLWQIKWFQWIYPVLNSIKCKFRIICLIHSLGWFSPNIKYKSKMISNYILFYVTNENPTKSEFYSFLLNPLIKCKILKFRFKVHVLGYIT